MGNRWEERGAAARVSEAALQSCINLHVVGNQLQNVLSKIIIRSPLKLENVFGITASRSCALAQTRQVSVQKTIAEVWFRALYQASCSGLALRWESRTRNPREEKIP